MGNSLRTSDACAFEFVGLTEYLVLLPVLCVVLLAPTAKAMRECFCASDFKSSMRAAFTRGSPTWRRSFSRMARRFEIFDRSSASLLKGALRRRAWHTTLVARAAPYSPNRQNSCDCGSSSLCSSSLWRFPLVLPRAVCGRRDRQLSRRVSRLAARNWRESGSRNEASGGTEAARSCFSSQFTPCTCDGVKLLLGISDLVFSHPLPAVHAV
jgi:hypothetical protein